MKLSEAANTSRGDLYCFECGLYRQCSCFEREREEFYEKLREEVRENPRGYPPLPSVKNHYRINN